MPRQSMSTAHYKYNALGRSEAARQQEYRPLFKVHISEKQLEEIRAATNKEWVLGSDYFKARIAEKLKRRASPLPRGGNWKSKHWRERYDINRH